MTGEAIEFSHSGCLVLFVLAARRTSSETLTTGQTDLQHTLRNNYAALPHSSPAWRYRSTKGRFPDSPRTSLKISTEEFNDTDHARVFLVPSVQTGGHGGSLNPLVNFYSKLPKGPAPQSSFGGLKARYFTGKNASAAPVLATILGIFTIGYTIDYQSAYSCPRASFPTFPELTLTVLGSFHFFFSHDLYLRTGFNVIRSAFECVTTANAFALWNDRN